MIQNKHEKSWNSFRNHKMQKSKMCSKILSKSFLVYFNQVYMTNETLLFLLDVEKHVFGKKKKK